MNPLIIPLVLTSTFMHAGWNLLSRGQNSEAIFFHRMLLLISLIGVVPVISSELLDPSLNPKAWLFAACSGFFNGTYFLFLARAYRASDFTAVYPVARALPVLLVGIADMLRGRYPTAQGWIGMWLVISGCFLAPLYSFRCIKLNSYFNRTTLWMILTAFGTVGYTLFDKFAAEVVKQGPATAARYGYVLFLFSCGAHTLFLRYEKTEDLPTNSVGWIPPFFGACLMFGAYWLVLWAYQLSPHAGYIVAFRQFSIVIGVITAFIMYKERGLVTRLTGTFMITSGLVLISLWGQ
jgi:uncharacterized membrane protein